MCNYHILVLARMAHEVVTFYSLHASIAPSQELGFSRLSLYWMQSPERGRFNFCFQRKGLEFEADSGLTGVYTNLLVKGVES